MDASKTEGLLEKMLELSFNAMLNYQYLKFIQNGPTMYIKLTSYLMCGPNSYMERQITYHTHKKNKGINRWSLSNLRPLGLELWQWRYYQIEINMVLLTKVKHVLPFVLTIAMRKHL